MRRDQTAIGRLPRCLFAICCLTMSSPTLAADRSMELVEAFMATYRQAPPLMHIVETPVFEHVNKALAPVLPVKLEATRYALLVSGTVQGAGHSEPGTFSIAYLRYDEFWTLEQLWPDLAIIGVSGIPADVVWTLSFGANPLVLVSSAYCGMGACSDSIAVFSLGKAMPRFVGSFPGKAEDNLVPGLNHYPSYRYTARIGAPALRKNVLSVTYAGWTAPSGSTTPKYWFSRKTDYATSADGLKAVADIAVPDCR